MKILLGIGGTDDSLEALEKTVVRANAVGDDLTVAILNDPESDSSPAEIKAAVRETLAKTDCTAELRLVDGDPGSRLVEIAETEGFDRIVLGGGQQSPMGKIRLGPTPEFVILNSHVSVTLIR
jgi:nucleotide-binding universal stress UspA family protein